MDKNIELELLEQQLESKLIELHGSVLLSGDALYSSLGYKSSDAFRQAQVRNSVPVRIFAIKHRRGKFALASDVARWLAKQIIKKEGDDMLD